MRFYFKSLLSESLFLHKGIFLHQISRAYGAIHDTVDIPHQTITYPIFKEVPIIVKFIRYNQGMLK